jgi:hypothetical protein
MAITAAPALRPAAPAVGAAAAPPPPDVAVVVRGLVATSPFSTAIAAKKVGSLPAASV